MIRCLKVQQNPLYSIYNYNNKVTIKVELTNTRRLPEVLPTELSVGFVELVVPPDSSVDCSLFWNWNSPKLRMGFGALNAPPMSFVIWKMLTWGLVAALEVENWSPSSVPASHGGNMVTSQLCRHVPLLHRSRLSIPMNQSGEGANIVIIDTLEKFGVTSTSIPDCTSSGPSEPPGKIRFQAFLAVIWASISFKRVLVEPVNIFNRKLTQLGLRHGISRHFDHRQNYR